MNDEPRPFGSAYEKDPCRHIITGTVVVLALFASGSLASSLISYETLKHLAENLSDSGHANGLTSSFYQNIIIRVRIAGCLAAFIAIAMWSGRRNLGIAFRRIGLLLSEELRSLTDGWRSTGFAGKRAYVFLGIAVLAVGFWLRLCYIDQPVRYDEAFSFLVYANRGLLQILFKDYTPNNQMLHTEFMWVLSRVLGGSAVVLRIPAFMAGILLIPATYQYTHKYHGPAAALFAAGLVAANADLIMFSTNARGYTILGLTFLCLIQIADALGREPQRVGLWVPFVVLSVLGLYTIPTMMYGIGVCVALFLVQRIRLTKWHSAKYYVELGTALALVAILTAFLYLPVLVGSGPSAIFGNRYVSPDHAPHFASRMIQAIEETWAVWHAAWPVSVVLILSAGAVVAALSLWGNRGPGTARNLILALAVCAGIAACQRVIPPPRVWLFLLPLYFAAAAGGLALLLKRAGVKRSNWVLNAGTILVLGWNVQSILRTGIVITMPETGTNIEAAEVASLLATEHKQGDTFIATLPASYPVLYYLHRRGESITDWTGPNPERILAVLDKPPGREFTEEDCRRALTEAFDESFLNLDQARYQVGGTLSDMKSTRIVILNKAGAL